MTNALFTEHYIRLCQNHAPDDGTHPFVPVLWTSSKIRPLVNTSYRS